MQTISVNQTVTRGVTNLYEGVEVIKNSNNVQMETVNTSTETLPSYTVSISDNTKITYGDETDNVQIDIEETEALAPTATTYSAQEYQSKLLDMGFYSGPLDGNLSSDAMIPAIKGFQKLYGCSVTGTIDSNTSAKLTVEHRKYTETLNSDGLNTIASQLYLDYTQKRYFAMTWTFLRDKMGLTIAQTAGVIGNIYAESAIVPNNAADSDYPGKYNSDYTYIVEEKDEDLVAYGLIQWKERSRKEALLEAFKEDRYATTNILPPSNINTQLAMIEYEANNTYKTAWTNLKKCTTAASAAQVFMSEFEQCGSESLSARVNYANIIYNAMV